MSDILLVWIYLSGLHTFQEVSPLQYFLQFPKKNDYVLIS